MSAARLLGLLLLCAGAAAGAQTGAGPKAGEGPKARAVEPSHLETNRGGKPGLSAARQAATSEVAGEWACSLRYGRGAAGFRRDVVVILDPDGSFLVQGRKTESFLVLGKWFRAPSGEVFGSGRVQRFGRGGLGQLFALELRVEGERLVSDQDPRAECRRP